MGAAHLTEAELTARPLRVAAAPVHSLVMALRDAAGAERAATPETWRRVIRARLSPGDYAVMAPLSTPRPTMMPSALVPLPGPAEQTIKDGIEQVIASEDVLAAEIEDCRLSGATAAQRGADLQVLGDLIPC